ncbi:MAG: aldo/keto reductase [Actinobacteria bacterium]|nr:aldo/keto reductase [Actinomycetota bacterium]
MSSIPTSTVRDRITLTKLGLGCAQFGNLFRETTDEACTDAVMESWNSGVRYIDVAPHYGLGLGERRVGQAIKSLPRGEIIISTKVGRVLVPSPDTAHQQDEQGFVVPADVKRVFDFSRDGIMRSFEDSLKRLAVDYIDILYLHDPDAHWESASTTGVQALIELRDQGVVKAIGAGMNQHEMLTRFVKETDIDLVMLAGRFTLLEQESLTELLPAALARNIGIVNVGVYNSGLLAKPRPDAGSHYNYVPASTEVLARVNNIADVCEKYGVSLPEAALAYVQLHPAVCSVVLGARDGSQARENAVRFGKEIPAELWTELAQLGLIADPASFK